MSTENSSETLVRAVLSKYRGSCPADDLPLLAQAARVAIWRAGLAYDPDRQCYVALSADRLASIFAHRAIRDELEKCRRHRARLADDPEDVVAFEPAPDPETAAMHAEFAGQVTRAVGELSDFERAVILGRMAEDKSYRALAEELGCSHECVRQVELRALRILKDTVDPEVH